MNVEHGTQIVDIDVSTLSEWMRRGEAILIDVREREEFAEERIPGAVPIPLSDFDPDTLPRSPGKRLVLSCFIGGRSYEAAERTLAATDAEIFNLDGGLFAWKEAGLTTDTGQPRTNAAC